MHRPVGAADPGTIKVMVIILLLDKINGELASTSSRVSVFF